MASDLRSLDWTLIHAFLAVADEGSLSAAARRLGVSQPTLGRHIKTLEATLGAALLSRHARGFALTDLGVSILPAARDMLRAADVIRVAAEARQEDLHGTVRLTSSRNVGYYVLPGILAKARQRYPQVSIELVATDSSENLIYGEADIALRMFRPTQLELITTHVGDLEIGLYGAKSYLDRMGRPRDFQEMLQMDIVGYDKDTRVIDGMAKAGLNVDRDFFALRCDEAHAQWEMIAEGCGLGFQQVHHGDADPRVERLEIPFPAPSLPIWLTARSSMRQIPRMRAIWDLLYTELPRYCLPEGNADA